MPTIISAWSPAPAGSTSGSERDSGGPSREERREPVTCKPIGDCASPVVGGGTGTPCLDSVRCRAPCRGTVAAPAGPQWVLCLRGGTSRISEPIDRTLLGLGRLE